MEIQFVKIIYATNYCFGAINVDFVAGGSLIRTNTTINITCYVNLAMAGNSLFSALRICLCVIKKQ